MTQTFALSLFAALAVAATSGVLALTVVGVVTAVRAVIDARRERELAHRFVNRQSNARPDRKATP